MADRSFTVDIVTPERVLVHDTATYLQAPGVQGSFGILPNHAPLLSELSVGELRYRRENGQEVRLAIGGGFLQIFNNEVSVLADTAERAEEIDVERARRALTRAQGELSQALTGFDAQEHATREAGVERARKMERFFSQPFFVAQVFTGVPGAYVSRDETVRGFREILEGKHDDLPEQAFYMVGTIDQAVEKAKRLAS